MEGEQPPRVLSLVTTVGSQADAQQLAGLLLERRLAACVQVEPGLVSHYVWQGRRCEEPELRLTIKSLPDRAAALKALFDQHHPYELPQFLSTELDASSEYAAWVAESLAQL
ncbi:divalent-cation tolerance protein CutA [Caenimonas terrae]|uniref:Divalent-cation tolerance protein CutA n=1 Tax=Caenimonas terrae TaxID=696074 RepID=A0ABW0N7N8_9BURK